MLIQGMYAKHMRVGDSFLSNRSGWVTVVGAPIKGEFGYQIIVEACEDTSYGAVTIQRELEPVGVYRVHRPAHRAFRATDDRSRATRHGIDSASILGGRHAWQFESEARV